MISTEQKRWTRSAGWQAVAAGKLGGDPQLVFVFGGSSVVKDENMFRDIQTMYPKSNILSCSTAGEILERMVSDDSIALTAAHFEKSAIKIAEANITNPEQSQAIGEELAQKLPADGLVHVMIFSDGLKVNGSALVNGLDKHLPEGVAATGGLVGDGSDFKHTFVGINRPPEEGKIIIIGFYGQSLRVGYGSLGGWDPFGPERKITKSKGNILYELDGESALDLYKKYLGDKAKELPSSGLLFPLSLRMMSGGREVEVVRTLLAIDEKEKSMTFAGDMPEGVPAKLMKANFERLLDGASGAATLSLNSLADQKPELAILISCIGRKLVLKERIEEEIDAVRSVVGPAAAITGFYSYGELCPSAAAEKQCQLHNQTMTITAFKEI